MNDKFNKTYIGIVKENEDYYNMGRLGVEIPELSTVETTFTVSYASPFIGASDPNDMDTENTETFEGTQLSYGFWAVPPSINSGVLVSFINGEPSRGYWFACIPQQFMTHMLPNIPVGDSYQYDEKVPVAEYNKFSNEPNKRKGKRPFHKTHYESIRNQGLKKDKIRGFSQHGAVSDPTSRVMGMLSPKGHYWSLEDTKDDEKIRLRTKHGVQLLLDDSRGLVYIINKKGTGWVEVDENGKIMVYGEEGIAFRTKKDFTVRADRDIILESGRDIYLRGEKDIKTETNNFLNTAYSKFVIYSDDDVSIAGKNLDIDMTDKTNFLVGNEFNIGAADKVSINSNSDVAISGNAVDVNASSNLTLSGNGTASLSGNGSLDLHASGATTISGATINQNMGGGFIGAKAASPTRASVIEPDKFELFNKTDIVQPESDDEPEESAFPTLVTTLPTHEPCPEHGVEPEDLG